MSKWQPIETAPRDGTRILVYVPEIEYEHVIAAQWFEWADKSRAYFQPTSVDTAWEELPATHWMPHPGDPE